MEDVIAVEVRLDGGARRFFVTWGRIQDQVDPDPVCALVMRFAEGCSLGTRPVAARMCPALREAADTEDAPLFYEALARYSRNAIPFGDGYEEWREQIAEAMERGEQIYYCGQPVRRGAR